MWRWHVGDGDGDGQPAGATVVRLLHSINMLGVNELHLLELLDTTAPLTAHLFHELRRLGYKMAVGWVVRPPAAGDETIHDA